MRYVMRFRFECECPSDRPIVDDGLNVEYRTLASYSPNSKSKILIILPLLFHYPLHLSLPNRPTASHTAWLYERLPLHARTHPLPLARWDLLRASSAHWVDSEIAESGFTYAVRWGCGRVPDCRGTSGLFNFSFYIN
jgi:hypothetical protein